MKFKSVILLVVAVGCGLVAMLGVQQVLSGDRRDAKPQDVARVLVATADIAPGIRLTEENCALREWPRDAIPRGAVTTSEQYKHRALLVRAVPGEIIMQAKLGAENAFGAASSIPVGMRVVTVPVDMSQNISGLLLPGDRVDILATYKTRRAADGGYTTSTKTVLENVQVFATDNRRDVAGAGSEAAEVSAKNVSFLVMPNEANQLKLAESMGKLHMALRPKDDDSVARASEARDDGLEKQVSQPNPEPRRPVVASVPQSPQVEKSKWQVEVFAGDKKTVHEFELPDEVGHDAPSVEPLPEPVEIDERGPEEDMDLSSGPAVG
jgi:pilus assembly protein CpaB